MKKAKRYNDEGVRLTDCCGAMSTYHDITLCCKVCWNEVEVGQGDGSEYKKGVESIPSWSYKISDDDFK